MNRPIRQKSKINLDQIVVLDHLQTEFQLKDLISKSQLNGLFFGSSSCQSCREFVRKLNAFKQQLDALSKPFQTILISCDLNAKELDTFYDSMNKDLAEQIKHFKVKFDRNVTERLYTHFCVTKVPTVIILDNNGFMLTQYARGDIEYRDHQIYDDWIRMTQNY